MSFNGAANESVRLSEDKNSWNISLVVNGLMLTKDDLSFKVPKDEFDKLEFMLEKHKKGSIKVGHKRYVFKPNDRGFEVSILDDGAEGKLLPVDQFEEILNLFRGEDTL